MFRFFKRKSVPLLLKVSATLTFIIMLVINGLAGSTEILGGVATGEVSDTYANLFAPAGFTFSIWGLIYLFLAVFVVRMWRQNLTKAPQLETKQMIRVVRKFTLTSVLNTAWLLAWQYQILWLSVIIMLGLLTTLLFIQRDLSRIPMSRSETIAVRSPFSLYVGWISVATIANITAWLVSIDWRGGGIPESNWTVIILLLGAAVGLATALYRYDWVYLVVFIWAYFGILYKHMATFEGQHQNVIITLGISLTVYIVFVLLIGLRQLTPIDKHINR